MFLLCCSWTTSSGKGYKTVSNLFAVQSYFYLPKEENVDAKWFSMPTKALRGKETMLTIVHVVATMRPSLVCGTRSPEL